MPHIILEATGDFAPKETIKPLLLSLHQLVAKVAGAEINSCKSRFIQHDSYVIGDGEKHTDFLHLTIKLLSGRTQEQLCALGEQAFALLKAQYSNIGTEIDITVLVDEMAKQHYYKD